MAMRGKSGGGPPKRGDVTKGIVKEVINVVKEAKELSAEQLNANVRAFKERQANLRASADARRREKLRSTANAKKQGRGLPKRRDVKKGIGKELIETPVKKLINVVKNRNEGKVKELSAEQLVASVRASKDHQPAPEIPMSESLTSSSTTSSLASDSFLQTLPFPTKKEAMAKLWHKVDMIKALVHKGSVLFEEQKGKWAVMGPSSNEAAEIVIPLITPSLRVATPL